MLPNPRYYNPFKRAAKARHRQEQVLFNMHQAKLLSDEEYTAVLAAPVVLRSEGSGNFDFSALSDANGRPCYQHVLEQVLVERYGEQDLYRGGLTIRTTLDKQLEESVRRWEESRQDKKTDTGDTVTVIKEAGIIRAIACTEMTETDLQAVTDYYPDLPFNRYETSVISPDAIPLDQLILPSSTPGASASTSN